MSSISDEKIRQSVEDLIRTTYRAAWEKSKQWPNHRHVSIVITWDGDRPDVTTKPSHWPQS